MKNNLLTIALCSAGALTLASCTDFLDTSSTSTITSELATSSIDGCENTMAGTYASFHEVLIGQIFGNGLFYALDAAGSDIERHGGEQALGRLKAETFYNGGDDDVLSKFTVKTDLGTEDSKTAFAMLNSMITKLNILIEGISEEKMSTGAEAERFKRVYAEAICMRATCYRELIKYYGDVFKVFSLQDNPTEFTCRLDIYDIILADLDKVKDILPDVENNHESKTAFSKQYAYGLAGRIALEAAGYQTYRLDITEASRLEKHPDYTDNHNATYARPVNYREYIQKAYDSFKYVADHMGGIKFSNDYSTFFTQLHDVDGGVADESIFEDESVSGSAASGNNERPYSLGRPATSSNKFGVCKSYGQARINPAFYYGVFDPRDKRRDISCVVTGSYLKAASQRKDLAGYDGKSCCYEVILPFVMKSSGDGGGIACGKFDENRQVNPYITAQRRSGINSPYMRISEIYLGLAEAAQVLGKPEAATYYNMIRTRAGLPTSANPTYEEIIDERGFEFAGEGDRRWTLIRSGLIGKKVKAIKELTKKMIDGLNASGYYTFDNGNTIGNYIYYKGVDPTALGMDSRVTDPTPENMLVAGYEPTTDLEAVQFPGWRGQHDWSEYTKNGYPNSNIAIKGLFTNITSTPEGYYQMEWGKALVAQENTNGFWYNDLFKGWDCKSAPIYLVPFSENALVGGFTNGYGFTSTFE